MSCISGSAPAPTSSVPLRPQSVADFYREFLVCLQALGVSVEIHPVPVEIPNPIPFDRRPDARFVRPGLRPPVLADSFGYRPFVQEILDAFPRQNQPGPFFLGKFRFGGNAIFRASRAAARWRRLDYPRSVLARSDQRRILAGQRRLRRTGLLLLCRACRPQAWKNHRLGREPVTSTRNSASSC